MSDIIEKIGSSVIQHGKMSDRVYLMKLSEQDFPSILKEVKELAVKNGYAKIFAKVPGWAKKTFESDGYKKEAHIPCFYNGVEDVFFMAKYLNPNRERISNAAFIAAVIQTAKNVAPVQMDALMQKDDYHFCILNSEDVADMVSVYKMVFKTYPFPIHDTKYLVATMEENIVYFGIWDKKSLVAVSSCEMDVQSKNVEMTDFATLPEYRGQGLALYLLINMEAEMKKRGMLTAYTIARAESYGMNITFAKARYTYAGLLVNNTNISGGIESMNVWYKALQ